jgi:type IV secretion system protein VirB8
MRLTGSDNEMRGSAATDKWTVSARARGKPSDNQVNLNEDGNVAEDASLVAYLREASSWDADAVIASRLVARRAWVVAAIAIAIALLALVALAMLTPLKSVEPFLIRVDNTTGAVDPVPLFAGHENLPEVVSRYFLTHYVLTCERYNPASAEQDYNECGAFHNARRNQEWYALWNRANPSSPLNQYRDGSTVSAQIQSISFLEPTAAAGLAQVRFIRAVRHGSGSSESITHWIATIQFSYAEPPSDPRTRAWNPLGFRVLDYHTEPEVVDSVGAPNKGKP